MFSKILSTLSLLSTCTLCFATQITNNDTHNFKSLNQLPIQSIPTNQSGSALHTQSTTSCKNLEKLHMPTTQRENLIGHMKGLADTQIHTIPLLTHLLMQTPVSEHSKLIEQANELALPTSNQENISYILKELLQVPFIERPSIVNQVKQLVAPTMDCKEISNIIQPLLQIPFSERQSTIESVKHIIERMQQTHPSKIDGDLIQGLVQKHQVIKPEEFINFFNLLEKLLVTVNTTDNQIIELTSPLLHPQLSQREINCIRRNLLAVRANERSSIIEQVKQISHPAMTGDEINSILYYLTDIPFEKRPEVIELVQQKTNQGMTGQHHAYNINNKTSHHLEKSKY